MNIWQRIRFWLNSEKIVRESCKETEQDLIAIDKFLQDYPDLERLSNEEFEALCRGTRKAFLELEKQISDLSGYYQKRLEEGHSDIMLKGCIDRSRKMQKRLFDVLKMLGEDQAIEIALSEEAL